MFRTVTMQVFLFRTFLPLSVALKSSHFVQDTSTWFHIPNTATLSYIPQIHCNMTLVANSVGPHVAPKSNKQRPLGGGYRCSVPTFSSGTQQFVTQTVSGRSGVIRGRGDYERVIVDPYRMATKLYVRSFGHGSYHRGTHLSV